MGKEVREQRVYRRSEIGGRLCCLPNVNQNCKNVDGLCETSIGVQVRGWSCEKGNGLGMVGQHRLETNATEAEKPGRKGNQDKKTCYRQWKRGAGFSGFKEERGIYFR